MFSKIVPAFTSDNIGALGRVSSWLIYHTYHVSSRCNLGPLILVAVLYEVIGIMMAWIIKQFFWVPHRFRYGILVAGGWGNYGDIRESLSQTIYRSLIAYFSDVGGYECNRVFTIQWNARPKSIHRVYFCVFLCVFCKFCVVDLLF
jgi:predicted permease